MRQQALFEAPTGVRCVACGDPIDLRANHADGPMHVHCAFEKQAAPVGPARNEGRRTVDHWKRSLLDAARLPRSFDGGRLPGAVTGPSYRNTTATLAEHPDRLGWWDYRDGNGDLRMPYVEIWANGCPGEPGLPGRFENRLPCRYGHLHPRDELSELGLDDVGERA